jgi:hypothetical protein
VSANFSTTALQLIYLPDDPCIPVSTDFDYSGFNQLQIDRDIWASLQEGRA